MTAVINNLCYKNKKNKEFLGVNGLIKPTVSVYKVWASD